MDLTQLVYDNDLVGVEDALKAGANPDIVNGLGQPLIFAPIILGRYAMVKLLLDHGANPDIMSDYGGHPAIDCGTIGNGRHRSYVIGL
jgi:hypothetical protein